MRRIPLLCLLLACGPVEQSASCRQYVECIAARDVVNGTQTDTLRFAAAGACWGGKEGADLCDHACKSGLAWLADKETNVPEECVP